jgi:hypothetical protein
MEPRRRPHLPVSEQLRSAARDACDPVCRPAEMVTQLLVFPLGPQGQISVQLAHGRELSAEQLFHMRPAPGYADFRTPIRRLYQASSATHGGGGVSGIPRLPSRQIDPERPCLDQNHGLAAVLFQSLKMRATQAGGCNREYSNGSQSDPSSMAV